MRLTLLCLLVSAVFAPTGKAQVPVFEINQAESSIKFNVKASVPIAGTFGKWDATVTFTSPAYDAATLDVKIQAASVNTAIPRSSTAFNSFPTS